MKRQNVKNRPLIKDIAREADPSLIFNGDCSRESGYNLALEIIQPKPKVTVKN